MVNNYPVPLARNRVSIAEGRYVSDMFPVPKRGLTPEIGLRVVYTDEQGSYRILDPGDRLTWRMRRTWHSYYLVDVRTRLLTMETDAVSADRILRFRVGVNGSWRIVDPEEFLTDPIDDPAEQCRRKLATIVADETKAIPPHAAREARNQLILIRENPYPAGHGLQVWITDVTVQPPQVLETLAEGNRQALNEYGRDSAFDGLSATERRVVGEKWMASESGAGEPEIPTGTFRRHVELPPGASQADGDRFGVLAPGPDRFDAPFDPAAPPTPTKRESATD
jgi:hypothetical protein